MKMRFKDVLGSNSAFFILFAFLAILFTWPAIIHLQDRVIGDFAGDNFHFLWELWYVAHAAFDLHKNPFFDPDIYVPFGFDLIKNQDLSPGTVLLFLPLTRLIGEVATFNLLIIASFALTAFGAFLFARELWQNRAGALFAALSVGFCAYRFSHAGGHLSIASTQWILFFFFYLERTLKCPSVRNGLITGLFYGLSAWATWYYAWSIPIGAACYVVARVNWRRVADLIRLLKAGLGAAGVSLLLILPFAIPYARAVNSGAMAPRSLGEAQAFAASVADYFIPAISQSFWGGWVQEHWRSGGNGAWLSEWELYLGLPTLLLGAVGAARAAPRRIVWSLLVLAASCFLFSLGPGLYFIHPPALSLEAADVALSPVVLPGRFLNSFPPFSLLRSWARLGFFVEIAVAMLAAGGLTYLLEKLHHQHLGVRLGLTAAFVVAVVLDLSQLPLKMVDVRARAVDRWLAKQPGRSAIMEFPIPGNAYSGPAMYSTRLSGNRIAMGYASYPPNAASFPVLAGFPSENSLDLLQSWGVTYVLVNADLYSAGSQFNGVDIDWTDLAAAIAATPRLHPVVTLEGVHVYELRPRQLGLVGKEIIPDPSFESVAANDSKSWMKFGAPEVEPNAHKSHQGKYSCVVDPANYLVTRPLPVSAGSCYLLRTWSQRATSSPATTALKIIWLDDAQHPLPVGAEPVEADDVGREWTQLQDTFQAPLSSRFAVVCATTKAGRARVDDYSFQQVASCEASFSAVPNPLDISPPGESMGTAISWISHSGKGSYVTFAPDGGPETFFAKGSKGTKVFSPPFPKITYTCRLYDSFGQLLKTLTVVLRPTEWLTVSPVKFSPDSDNGTTHINWKLPAGQAGKVYVSINGAPKSLFAKGVRGSQEVTWLTEGNSYEFQLYNSAGRVLNTLAFSVKPVTRLAASPIQFPPNSDTGSTLVSWRLPVGQTGKVYVSIDRGPEFLFATGHSGSKEANWIAKGRSYEFRLRNSSDETVKTLPLFVKPPDLLSASPVHFPPGSDIGSVVITWKPPAGVNGNVFVSDDGGIEHLFAQGQGGSKKVDWIRKGSSYEFRLYSSSEPRQLLAKVVVRG